MTVKKLSEGLGLRVLSMPAPEREVLCGYAGDLLSWVMGRAKEGSVWATVMTNVNVVAVEVISVAKEKGINLLSSELPIYEFCVAMSQMIK